MPEGSRLRREDSIRGFQYSHLDVRLRLHGLASKVCVTNGRVVGEAPRREPTWPSSYQHLINLVKELSISPRSLQPKTGASKLVETGPDLRALVRKRTGSVELVATGIALPDGPERAARALRTHL